MPNHLILKKENIYTPNVRGNKYLKALKHVQKCSTAGKSIFKWINKIYGIISRIMQINAEVLETIGVSVVSNWSLGIICDNGAVLDSVQKS